MHACAEQENQPVNCCAMLCLGAGSLLFIAMQDPSPFSSTKGCEASSGHASLLSEEGSGVRVEGLGLRVEGGGVRGELRPRKLPVRGGLRVEG